MAGFDLSIEVDANILLDFYRMRRESGLFILRRFDRIHDRLVTTYQVKMEFKKNRQTVIYDSRKNLKSEKVTIPASFLYDTKTISDLKVIQDDGATDQRASRPTGQGTR